MKKNQWFLARYGTFLFIVIYIILSIIIIYFNIKANDLIFINIQDFLSEAKYSEKAISILSINITLVSIFATLAIGVVTILLGKTNIKLSDYLKYVVYKDGGLLLLCFLFINTIFSLFVIYQTYTVLLDIWLKIAVLPSIVLFIVLIKNFEVVDKEEKMKEHLLTLLDKNNKDKFINFMFKITNNCFNNEFYSILSYVMEETKINDKKQLFSINKEIINKKIDIDYILKMQSFVLPSSANDSFFNELQDKYLDLAFSKYKKIIFERNIGYNNFIMRVKSNLYANILVNEMLSIEKKKLLLNNYLDLMFRSYELVIIILDKNNIKDTREAINDFLGLVQFFSVNKIVNRNTDINVNKRYNYYLVGIVCWIFNRIIVNNLGIEYIEIIKTLFKRLDEIDLSGIESDMFEEIIMDINFHKIRYTRTFFIALSLMFLEKEDIHETLEKIYYDKTNYNNQYLFQCIIDEYKGIEIQEKRALGINQEEFDRKSSEVIQLINEKINSIVDRQNKDISRLPIKPEILQKEKDDIEKELKIFVRDNHENFIEEYLSFNTLMPRRYLIGDHSSIFIGTHIYQISVLLFFYKNFVANCKDIKMLKICDILEENTRLIMPAYLNEYIYQHDEFSYKDDGININGKYYPVVWIQARGPIITFNDLVNFMHLSQNAVEIYTGDDEEKVNELYTKCEVKIKYYKNNSNSNVGYSIL